MINTEKEMNEIAETVLSEMYNNPLIQKDTYEIFAYGVNYYKKNIIKYLSNKIIITNGEAVEIFKKLRNAICDAFNTPEEDAYNEGINYAQDIVCNYIHLKGDNNE